MARRGIGRCNTGFFRKPIRTTPSKLTASTDSKTRDLCNKYSALCPPSSYRARSSGFQNCRCTTGAQLALDRDHRRLDARVDIDFTQDQALTCSLTVPSRDAITLLLCPSARRSHRISRSRGVRSAIAACGLGTHHSRPGPPLPAPGRLRAKAAWPTTFARAPRIQLVRLHVLEQIAAAPAAGHRSRHAHRARGRRDNRHTRLGLAQFPQHIDAVHLRHAHVEQDDVRLRVGNKTMPSRQSPSATTTSMPRRSSSSLRPMRNRA